MDFKRGWWDEYAACAGHPDPNIFFEVEDARDEERRADSAKVQQALAVCGQCEVGIKQECLLRALQNNDEGIRGGLTRAGRRGIKKRMLGTMGGSK